jgi:hypothetical protein
MNDRRISAEFADGDGADGSILAVLGTHGTFAWRAREEEQEREQEKRATLDGGGVAAVGKMRLGLLMLVIHMDGFCRERRIHPAVI